MSKFHAMIKGKMGKRASGTPPKTAQQMPSPAATKKGNSRPGIGKAAGETPGQLDKAGWRQ